MRRELWIGTLAEITIMNTLINDERGFVEAEVIDCRQDDISFNYFHKEETNDGYVIHHENYFILLKDSYYYSRSGKIIRIENNYSCDSKKTIDVVGLLSRDLPKVKFVYNDNLLSEVRDMNDDVKLFTIKYNKVASKDIADTRASLEEDIEKYRTWNAEVDSLDCN